MSDPDTPKDQSAATDLFAMLTEISAIPESELAGWLAQNGYDNVRVLADGTIVGTTRLLFTTGLCVGLDRWGWERRYCYEDRQLAAKACEAMQSGDDEPLPGWVARR
jgi:hypothetical protein